MACSSRCSACLKAATMSVGVESSLKWRRKGPASGPSAGARGPRRRAPPPAPPTYDSVRGDSASNSEYGQFCRVPEFTL